MAEQFHAEEPLKNETRQKIADARLRLSQPKKRRPRWQPVVACACALALAVGLSAIPRPQGVSTNASETSNSQNTLLDGFLLTAYAADENIQVPDKASHDLVTFEGNGIGVWNGPFYSGCLFQIEGPDISTVTLSIDKGSLYLEHDLARNPDGSDNSSKELLQNPVTLSLEEDTAIGFALDPETYASIPEGDDLKEGWHNYLDYFNGATLTMTITFTDGTTQTTEHHLKAGGLKIDKNSTGNERALLPVEVSKEEQTSTPYIYAIYDEDFVS